MGRCALTVLALTIVGTVSAHLECGTWQLDYTSFHTRVLRGEAPPRFAVFVAVEAGLADNLLGLMTSTLQSVNLYINALGCSDRLCIFTGKSYVVADKDSPCYSHLLNLNHALLCLS